MEKEMSKNNDSEPEVFEKEREEEDNPNETEIGSDLQIIPNDFNV